MGEIAWVVPLVSLVALGLLAAAILYCARVKLRRRFYKKQVQVNWYQSRLIKHLLSTSFDQRLKQDIGLIASNMDFVRACEAVGFWKVGCQWLDQCLKIAGRWDTVLEQDDHDDPWIAPDGGLLTQAEIAAKLPGLLATMASSHFQPGLSAISWGSLSADPYRLGPEAWNFINRKYGINLPPPQDLQGGDVKKDGG